MKTYIKAIRGEASSFLDHYPNANHLLNVIARRARRTPCKLNMLEVGECFISFRSVGMSEQQYRTAKKQLQKWGLVTFGKGRKVTDKGTVALLGNSDIYDINVDDGNGRVTEEQRKSNGRVTTNKECNNDKNEKNVNNIDIYFSSFWESYPRKVGKPKALKAFNSAIKGMKLKEGEIQEFLSFVKQDCTKRFANTEKQFIPHPTSYINAEGWNDEY